FKQHVSAVSVVELGLEVPPIATMYSCFVSSCGNSVGLLCDTRRGAKPMHGASLRAFSLERGRAGQRAAPGPAQSKQASTLTSTLARGL
ncbi:MAG TPA: hypothetical protein VJP88_07650, partial [Caulobacteraceae bacterium]|nr:hypothetical protein [Caulobacteraceae bacterium]